MFALTRTHTFGRIKVPRKDHINSKSDVSNSLSLSLTVSLSRSSRLSRLDLASAFQRNILYSTHQAHIRPAED